MAYYHTYNPSGYGSGITGVTQPPNPYNPNYTPAQFNQPVQQQQQENGIIWVQGESGAKSFAVAPGRSVMLMDSEQSRFYIKTADASGMPMPLRIFEYSEVTPTGTVEVAPTGTASFVTRDEFDALVERIDAMAKKQNTNRKEKRNESAV